MSGLVEKVKEVVRSRSKHRVSDSHDSARPRNSSDQYVLASETSHPRSSMQETRQGRSMGDRNAMEGTTRSFAAMHMDESTNNGAEAKNLPPLPSNANRNIESARAQNGGSAGQYQQERSLTGNTTTPRTPTHQRNSSGAYGGTGKNISPEIVPDRDSSMKRKPLPQVNTDAGLRGLNDGSSDRERLTHPKGPRSPTGHRHTRSTDVAPRDPSSLVPHFTTKNAASPTSPTYSSPNSANGETQEKDLRLPAGFDLSNTEHTHVDTKIVPAVTQEKVHIQRTEVITKAIHRDVHIDHHYTYVQPIPILEVLPARHFRLDPKTGVKTEIAAPEGYELPAHLNPRKAEDYSHLRQSTRHYVVDEDSPNGKLETPSQKYKADSTNTQGTQNGHQNY